MALTTVDQGLLGTNAQYTGFKNRILNGGMAIDQRNAGALVTIAGGNNSPFTLDRYCCFSSTNACTVQRTTTAPAGFSYSLCYTQSGTGAASAGDLGLIIQRIEGYNCADLGYGTANAATVTLSFWVRSSLTGTFGLTLLNAAQNRRYTSSYTINSANTWEYKTIVIPGDTTGTWLTDNGVGIGLYWDMGVGTTYSTSAGSTWGTGTYYGLTGGTKITQTTGATFYITGVQLEKGSTATSFDYRPYGTELALCQRYFETSFEVGTAVAEGATSAEMIGTLFSGTADARSQFIFFSTKKRATPTITLYRGPDSATAGRWALYNGSWGTANANNGSGISVNGFFAALNKTSLGTTFYSYLTQGNWTASSEL